MKVKLAEAPSDEPRAVAAVRKPADEPASTAAALSKLGISVDALTPRIVETRRISDKLKGVVVTAVTPGSTAEGNCSRTT